MIFDLCSRVWFLLFLSPFSSTFAFAFLFHLCLSPLPVHFVENQKKRFDLLKSFSEPSTYVLKQWVKMQIGDMFRLVGDLSAAETHILRVVTALIVGSSERASNKEESLRILELANQGNQ